MKNKNVRDNYDVVAENYAARFRDEMDAKPFDRKMLDWLIEKTGDAGDICDLGCGPGQIAAYLRCRGAAVCGVDLSAEMVRQARRLNPEISFQTGDMLALERIADESFGGIAAFYSIVNIPPDSILQVFREMRRILRPGGVLLVAFHIGQEKIYIDRNAEQKSFARFFPFQNRRNQKPSSNGGI